MSAASFDPIASSPATRPNAPTDGFAKAPAGNPTLSETFRVFCRQASPRIIASALAVCLPVRIWLGDWRAWDLLVAGVLIALQPVTEWLIHAYVLHLKPIHIGRFTFDPRLARVHRAHHLDPWDLPSLFIPLRTIAIGLVVEPLLFFGLLPSHALAMTALTTATAIGLFYEWSHFLPHTAYRPKFKWWRDVIKYHRLHHFKNEHYWMGVSSSLGDKLLGTFPNVRDVANSDTVRTLLSRDDVTAARANLGSD